MNRRHFIKTATAATLAAGTLSRALAQTKPAAGTADPRFKNIIPPTRKLRVACVGVGGRGYSNVMGCSEAGAEIVALCDVDRARAATTFSIFPKAARYIDYRQMLDEMGDQIDAVAISTPDHMHFPPAILAINRGKHVYIEKPLTHTIAEARALKRAAARTGVVTQMGNQGHANNGNRLMVEWVAAGLIGKVTEITCWTNRPVWPQGLSLLNGEPVPETLDWNLWQGVANEREYSSAIVPFKWRGYWEYGCGALGDMACHIVDGPFWALDLRGDCKVSADIDANGGASVTAPKGAVVTYEFPERNGRAPLTFKWYEGSRKPEVPPELGPEGKLGKGGHIVRGEKGIIVDENDYGASPRLFPAELRKTKVEQTIPRVPGGNQYAEWIKACQGVGPAPGSNIVDYSADLTEMTLLGNLAMRTGRTIQWDSATATCVGDPEATRFVTKSYRQF